MPYISLGIKLQFNSKLPSRFLLKFDGLAFNLDLGINLLKLADQLK
jgi:hypothetical protein